MLSNNTIGLVKSTIPLLESAGVEITDHFYTRMFKHNPELKDVFNMRNHENGRQPFALFSAVAAYAKHIDDLDALGEAVERIAQKHVSFDVQPEQYAIVGHHLIATLHELAPDAFTPEIAEAWTEAYGVLADILIGREKTIYNESENQDGGWIGPRPFRVKDKIKESELVTSFIFEPQDADGVRPYQPGQFIAVRLKPEQAENIEIRQYSLSDKYNPASYRISVKRETIPVLGAVSNYLHDNIEVGDTVDLMPPAGSFVLKQNTKPTVLISAGVGITPMMSMLETLADKHDKNSSILFLHACHNRAQHSFKHRLDELMADNNQLQSHFWYSDETPINENTHQGLMDLHVIKDDLPIDDGEFYLCGPLDFMRFVKIQLVDLGVAAEQIHFETFGPHDDI